MERLQTTKSFDQSKWKDKGKSLETDDQQDVFGSNYYDEKIGVWSIKTGNYYMELRVEPIILKALKSPLIKRGKDLQMSLLFIMKFLSVRLIIQRKNMESKCLCRKIKVQSLLKSVSLRKSNKDF